MARPSWNAAVAREPAASLVASHLAPHLTQKPGFHHQQLNRETFSQLLEIINSQECKTLSLAEGINSICVSLKAGIQPFFELKSPQEKREHKGQILDCLKIVTRGSFMKPEALLAPADPVILGKNVTASLSDWVVRDVLLLLCSVNDEEIYAGVVDLLQCVCLRSSMRIFDILSASLHDLLASVEESGYCPTAPICFPGNSGFFLASLGELGCTRLIFDRTSTLDDFAHVVAVCVCIFKATTVALQHMTMITPAKPASLMLRNFNELWDSFLVIIEESGSSAIEQCLVRSLDVLLLELGQAYRFLVLEPSHQKFAWQIMERLLNCCVDLLSCSKLSHNSSLQRSLGQLLHGIQENNILFSENGGTVLRETLGPELRRFLADNESSVEPLIQNFAARLLGGVDESTINLDYHSFQNNDQQTRKHTIGLDGEEESTVRKRRRLNSSDCVDADSIELSSYGLTIDTNGIVRGLHGFSERLNPCLMGESAGPILAEIGYMSCICAGSLDVPRHRERCDISSFCSICDSISSPVLKHAVWSDPDADELLKALLKILPALTDQVDSRVTAALTMKKILMHCPQEEHLILQTSPVGEACLQFLRSSIREVRIATTKTITAFLQKRLKSAIRRDNFMSVLDFLQHMLDSKDMTLMETAILAFTQVAKAAGDREMNIILLRLVEVLGHENPFLSDVAFSEMFSLAEAADIMPFELFKPFWRTISILAIVNMDKRPKILSQLCELTMMSLEAFLRSSQEYIIPYLVSMKKYDIIEMIDPERRLSCMDICKQESNLTSLLAFLLTQPSGNYDTLVTSTFTDMSPDTDSHTLNEWVSIQGIEVTCELLRELGESTQENRPTYLRALELVASLKPTRRAASSVKEGSTLALYIEKHILGIIRIFSQAVNESRRSMVEKRRNILAIGEMVRLAPNHVNAALLQICACLRSALNILDLCDHALISWDIMVRSLEQEELESLLDQTYCIIIKYWDLFQEEESRNRGRQLLEWLRSDRKTVVQSVFESLPALDSIPELQGPEVPAASRLESSDERRITNFIRRLSNEHAIVVEQALKELLQYLSQTRYWNDSTSVDQRATDIKVQLTRCLLNCCAKFNEGGYSIPNLAAQCLGTLGAVDPNQSEFVRPKKDIVVLSNFDDFAETCNFILFFIQNVLVRAYLSSDAESQGFLAWAMQHFLSLCGFQNAGFVPTSQASSMNNYYQRWFSLPKFVRNLLTPLLSSNYTIEPAIRTNCTHPIFSIHTSHSTWLRVFVLDMLHKAPKDGNKYSNVFEISSKIIKKRDIVIASFLLPYAALNIFLNGNDDLKNDVISEMLNVLRYPLPDNNNEHRKNAILCSESVFSIMDYCSRWAQARRKGMANLLMRPTGGSEDVYKKRAQQLSSLEATLSQIPAEVLSTRAVECQSFTRALLHWEKHIRRQMEPDSNGKIADLMPLYTRLQEIYAHIDEPDGAEGITADPHLFKIDQQVIESRRGTRWLAAQNWFSSQIAKDPEDCKAQIGLLSCLKDRGQHGVLLSQFDTLRSSEKTLTSTLPMVIDSAWMAGDLTRLSRYLEIASEKHIDDFAIGIGSVLQSLYCGETETATQQIESLRRSVAKGLTVNAVSSLKRSHESVLKLHALSELEQVAIAEKSSTFDDLNQRLTMLGGCIHDKCYVLNLRRVAMEILSFDASSVASVWLQLARSARKANNIEEAFNAVTRAVKLGEPQAALEFAKLLWREGSPRKAIQMLEETINSNALASAGYTSPVDSARVDRPHNPSLISAKAHLLLARWMDNAGQTQSEIIARKYRYAISLHPRWEKAHYHLGKHYAKILESEKSKPSDKQSHIFLSGEASKLVVDNFLRSLAYGNKYVFQSLPKILTLWFESAAALDEPYDERSGWSKDFHKHIMAQRLKSLRFINEQVRKYTDRIPTVLFLTILPQLVARICHPNKDLNAVLRRIIMKTTFTYVQQALWTILPLLKSLSVDRRKKGKLIFSEIQEAGRRAELSDRSLDITRVLREGQKLSDALVGLCSKEAKNRVSEKRTKASLTRDLLFDRSIARCSLVVPFETNMIPLLPLAHDAAYFAKFRPFPQGPVTFDDISDEVLILRSAQKPRKLNVRGSDGRMYGLLCKPEDLRKDERLMEFNRMINRFLKKDADSSSRQLYIKTYAVTPLNETSGLIEWVNNFRTLKDLIVRLLGDRGITLDWGQIQRDLSDTSSEKSKIEAFTSKVLRRYPPVFHEWFLEAFPEPGSWFAARLRYTRTCAVMSMVGHCLGLGDRHGENILFEEANGAVLHVDFNCLFDMGLTLQVPERVPFRLTHNMVDALGVCGYNGPFRRTSEITLSILRQSEDWLVPILETFVHDPTTEFLLAKQRTSVKVPSTAQEMLESVQNKLRGLLPGESVPLSVGGQVDELIMQATSTKNLAHMYVGWAPWL